MAHELGEVNTVGSEQIESVTSEDTGVLGRFECAHGLMNDEVTSRESDSLHSFISNLPPELLSHIFALILEDSPIHEELCFPRPRRTLGWFVVAHVCHQWRNIAIGSPILWQHINFVLGLAWVSEMLERSKGTLVSIEKLFPFRDAANLDDQDFLSDPALELMKAHLFHTAQLYLAGDFTQLSLAVKALDVPAPVLDLFHLHFFQYSTADFTPTRFFASHAPQIRTLSLVNFAFEQPINLPVTGLVNLYLTFDGSGSYLLSNDVGALLDFIQSIPTLQFLHISDTSTGADLHQIPWFNNDVVKLPFLTHLRLFCGKYVFRSLTNRLEIQPGILLDFTVFNPDSADNIPAASPDICATLPLVSNHMLTVAAIQTLSLRFDEQPYNENSYWDMRAQAWGVCCGGHDASAEPTATPVLRLEGGWSSTTSQTAIDLSTHLCASLPLTSVRVLSVASPFWTAAQWTDLFDRCGNLAHVHAAEGAAVALIRAVSALDGDLLVPRLETVTLELVDLRAGEEGGMSLGDVLISWLQRRQGQDAGLRRLHLLSCAASTGHFDGMSEVIEIVKISGEPMEVGGH